MKLGKKGNGMVIGIIIILLLIFVTSNARVEFNDKQIKTATETSCSLIKKVYDPVNKICVAPVPCEA